MMSTPRIIHVPTLDDILAGPDLIPMFQPIVRIDGKREELYGFESLARVRANHPFTSPDLLFDYASRKNRLDDLDLRCIERSLEHGRALAQSQFLFLNVHPDVFGRSADRLNETLLIHSELHGIPMSRLVIELTEQAPIEPTATVIESVHVLRSLGVRFAFDDVGSAHSHLILIDRIQPSFLKISQNFGTGFEDDPTKRKIIRNIVSLAAEFECQVVLEGIESQHTLKAAQEFGIRFGQGYHFSRPADASQFIASERGRTAGEREYLEA
ncbi:MAG: EAL domain-containing protein [Thermoanaerobaculia bacterium]